jgi:transcriptional regulator with XRE-family HTH domain
MNLKKLRKEKGLSQQGLADATGIPKGRIEKWETGKAKPKVKDSEILKKFFFEPVIEPEQRSLVEFLKEQLAEKEKTIVLLNQDIALLNQENGVLRTELKNAKQQHGYDFNANFPALSLAAEPMPDYRKKGVDVKQRTKK